ncbi:hypothetical protein JKP88DRAFT_252269 [Tribonema minus]|uniref:Uncharacterized protein n=1 Tax=Tribonema minus TaxID=303371 RepID=A0A835ZH63_9STRA|nr:hypothetical protein JKP88DRAFT_252269 [Tribonema minus]
MRQRQQSREATVLEMMKAFADSATVQLWGARNVCLFIPCVAVSSMDGKKASSAAAERLRAAGACELLSSALFIHRRSAGVQEAALRAVACLVSAGTHTSVRAHNWLTLRDAGIAEAIVAAMTTHGSNMSVQDAGIKAVIELARATGHADAAVRLASAEGHQAPATTITISPSRQCTQCIQDQLTTCPVACNARDTTIRQLLNAGASGAVVAALRLFTRLSRQPCQATAALNTIIALADRGGAPQLGAAGAGEAVLAALQRYPRDASLSAAALAAIRALATPHNRARLRRAGTCTALVRSLHSRETLLDRERLAQCSSSLQAVQMLARGGGRSLADAATLARLARAGACEAVPDVLHAAVRYNEHCYVAARMAADALSVIHLLSADAGLAARLSRADAHGAVASAMRAYCGDAEVQRLGQVAKRGLDRAAARRCHSRQLQREAAMSHHLRQD